MNIVLFSSLANSNKFKSSSLSPSCTLEWHHTSASLTEDYVALKLALNSVPARFELDRRFPSRPLLLLLRKLPLKSSLKLSLRFGIEILHTFQVASIGSANTHPDSTLHASPLSSSFLPYSTSPPFLPSPRPTQSNSISLPANKGR